MQSDGSSLEKRQLSLSRNLILGSGTTYFVWYFLSRMFLPGAVNPFGSRLAVVLGIYGIWLASFFSSFIRKHIPYALLVALCLITTHYYYLFYINETDVNWVVGCYITVIAICACVQNERDLLAYSTYALMLSIFLTIADRAVRQSIFLSGIVTVLVFANFGMRQRFRLNAEIRENALRVRSLLDSLFEGVIVHDNGVIQDANHAAASIFGYGETELIGKKIFDLVVPEARPIVANIVASHYELPYETTGKRKNGEIFDLEIHGKQQEFSGKSLRISAIQDITERKKLLQNQILYKSSQEALRIRDEFITIISHELKTPLTSLKLQTHISRRQLEMDKNRATDAETYSRFIAQIDRQADRLSLLVDDMLDITRISSNKFKIVKTEIDLSQIVRDTIDEMRDLFDHAKIALGTNIESNLRLQGDAFRIEQLVRNLLSNALKYGNFKPVEVQLERVGENGRLTVSDRGEGVAQENFERIFQKFERAVSSDNISGMGLGLFISREIVEAHDGEISVESKLGEGTSFIVTLPLTRIA